MIHMYRARAALFLGVAALSGISCNDSTAPRVASTVTITAPPSKVASDGALVLIIQDVVPLEVEVLDQSGSAMDGQTVQWSSSDQSIATVTADGLVTAVAVGSATITAKAGDATATLPVRVTLVPVAAVTVQGPSTLFVGESGQATATLSDASGHQLVNRAVAWSTDHPEVATVNDAGLIVATGPGTATITATSEGKSGTLTVTTTNVPVASISIQLPGDQQYNVDGTRALLLLPDTTEIRVVLRDQNGNQLQNRQIDFSIDAPNVLDVAPSGLTISKAFGNATVTATSEGHSASVPFVVVPSDLRVIRMNGSNQEIVGTVLDTLVAGDPVTYAVTVTDRNDNYYLPDTLNWHFTRSYGSNATIIIPADTVSAPLAGTVGIQVTADKVGLMAWHLTANGLTKTVPMLAQPAAITTSSDSFTIPVGSSFQITGQMVDIHGNPVNSVVALGDMGWSSADTNIATVSARTIANSNVTATITGNSAGTTQLTADAFGTLKTVTLTVTP